MLQTSPTQPYSHRMDPAVPSFPEDRPILVFDGKCVLCSGFAQFVIRRDPQKQFRFLAAQTALGQALYSHFGLYTHDYESNILLEDGQAYVKWAALLRVGTLLGFPWSWMAVAGRLVPATVGDWLYDRIAENRFRMFGGRDACYSPAADEVDRFLV